MSTTSSLVRNAQDRPGQSSRRHPIQAALHRAYETFSDRYPQWAQYLFDEHFLTHKAEPILIGYLSGSASPEPVALATAWAEQMTWFNEVTRQKRITQLTPAADHFLQLLEAEEL